jgi:hypothetical protein
MPKQQPLEAGNPPHAVHLSGVYIGQLAGLMPPVTFCCWALFNSCTPFNFEIFLSIIVRIK